MTSTRRALGPLFWLILIAALASMLATASLGRWQLARAAEKEALQARIDERTRQPAIDGRSLLAPAGPEAQQALVHRSVALQGRWLPQHTVYLDNRQMQGRPGFFVLTPCNWSIPMRWCWCSAAGRHAISRTACSCRQCRHRMARCRSRAA